MKKYDFRQEIMFYIYENDIEKFTEGVSTYFESELEVELTCNGIKNKEINFSFKKDDLCLNLTFLYDNSLFDHCYNFYGTYECNVYKGSRNIINKLYWYIRDNYQIITKKEPLYCTDCGKQIGWTYNDIDDFNRCCGDYDNSVSGFNKSERYENILWESDDIIRCIECGNFYCDSCANINYLYETSSSFTCKDCEDDDDIDDEYYEEDLIDKWGDCKFDEDDENKPDRCEDCEYYEDCIDNAEDNRDGYSAFCDCIVGHGYDSMDDFWECNGI